MVSAFGFKTSPDIFVLVFACKSALVSAGGGISGACRQAVQPVMCAAAASSARGLGEGTWGWQEFGKGLNPQP